MSSDHPSSASRLPGVVSDVVVLLAETPGVVAVVLGGSRALGTATENSDWDLGLYYRDRLELSPLRSLGEVHPPGSWGRLMNGGAWLTMDDGTRVDVLLRDLDAVERWTDEARDGRFEIDGLLGYLAGMPTYTLTAEVAASVVLHGSLEMGSDFPEPLTVSGPVRWRFNRDFSLAHARRAAALGNEPVACGQVARAMVEEAHARHCADGRWVLNEKRIFAGTGLPETLPGSDPNSAIRALQELITGSP